MSKHDVFPSFAAYEGGGGDPGEICAKGGLTKRELFAAMALQGMLSQKLTPDVVMNGPELAVSLADKLLAELARATP